MSVLSQCWELNQCLNPCEHSDLDRDVQKKIICRFQLHKGTDRNHLRINRIQYFLSSCFHASVMLNFNSGNVQFFKNADNRRMLLLCIVLLISCIESIESISKVFFFPVMLLYLH